MDNFNNRDSEDDILAMIRQPEGGVEDDSQFLNDSGAGMEVDQRDEAQTSVECNDDSQIGGHPRSGEVY